MINTQSKLTHLFAFLTSLAVCVGAYWMITDPTWTYEAVGGYFGGVLGGLSVLILVTNLYFQQKKDHNDDIMRRYELLYNDITGCSAQLFKRMLDDKTLKDKMFQHEKAQIDEDSLEKKKKQLENGDRGAFLRLLRDVEDIFECIHDDKIKVNESIDRYLTMCSLIFVGNSDIVKALEETDIGIVYKILKNTNKDSNT